MTDIMMRVPEFIILETIENALKIVRNDFADQVDEQKSLLWLLLQGTQFQRYNFFEQGKQVICCDIDDPRRLECDLMFNMHRNGAPTLHITLPTDTTDSDNGMGIDEGYVEPYYTDGVEGVSPGTFQSVFTRSYQSTVNIVIVSDNSNEIIFLYHFIRALLVSCYNHLSLSGLKNLKFGGQDIQPYQELQQQNFFMRTISVNFQYETSSIDFTKQLMVTDINFNGTPINE